jgi:hypothetical protein
VGVISEVTSEARDVVLLGGALRIGRVKVTARAWAGGHHGSAGSSLTRTVDNVTIDGTDVCAGNCDLSSIAEQTAVAFDGRLRINFPSPDPVLAAGSPGGFVAAIRRAPSDHYDDMTRDGWDANRWELPGMQITEINDTQAPSRTEIRLAGVEVEARYGVYPLDQYLVDTTGTAALPAFPSPITGVTATTAQPLLSPDATASQAAQQASGSTGSATGPQSLLAGLLPQWHGWRWLLQHPALVLRFAATWLLLLLPVHLAARRWMLIRRQSILVEA